MTDSEARDIVNGAALVIAAIYFYRKLIEPATTQGAAGSAAGSGAGGAGESPAEPANAIVTRWKGPAGGHVTPGEAGEPATVGGAAAQLFGQGKLPSTERFVVGWGFVFLVLSLSVDASPELAASFAALAALGSVLGNGVAVSKDLHTQLSTTPKAADTAATSATPTTTVSFAGQAATTTAALMPEGEGRRHTKPTKNTRFKVESA